METEIKNDVKIINRRKSKYKNKVEIKKEKGNRKVKNGRNYKEIKVFLTDVKRITYKIRGSGSFIGF